MGINRRPVLDLINVVHEAGGFSDYNSYSYLFDQVETMPESMEKPEPHWIPVTENTLPEENRVVVVCGDKGTWDYGTYRGHGNDIHFWHWKKNTYKRVYWWMYKEDALPEPFKGVME